RLCFLEEARRFVEVRAGRLETVIGECRERLRPLRLGLIPARRRLVTRAQGIRLSARVVHQFATGPGVLLLPADFLELGRLSSVVERPTSIEEERTRVDEVPAHESLLGTAAQVFRAAP